MGNNPNLTGPQVLQGMTEQFSKPYELSDPQVSRLADELFVIKGELPNTILITYVPNDQYANTFSWKLSSAFNRAGIQFSTKTQNPSSPSETGVMFSVADQNNPPPIVFKLQKVFDLVNIQTTVVNVDRALIPVYGFNIFVGPKPI
jgi:hypothetical protein